MKKICTDKNIIDNLLNELEKYCFTDKYLYKERVYIPCPHDDELSLTTFAIKDDNAPHGYYILTFKREIICLREFKMTIFICVFNNKTYILKRIEIENKQDIVFQPYLFNL